ncbi:peptidylprolyl isomerase [Terasakiella sp. A23]|uniref:peptidylprolyl isomerase n=1 Tax=Terasakiella sp. FCG-A23 TaxID=3080561 RepID=UPI00295306A3|nr:peptidylprolyl isomerase [Terasakiella sp. A23]MDV7340151.1 peptidylprolyl isomerase [Terasakiella sp. A23]
MKRFVLSFLVALTMAFTAQAQDVDKENLLYLDLKDGRVVIQMRPDLAPKHVERFKMLSRKGFYDNTPIHRVIPGFMAQMGDPTGRGTGGSDYPDLKAEFSSEPHVRGTLSTARTRNPNSANSQFFIMFDRASHLDNQYTVWGHVIKGMEFVDMIAPGEGRGGIVEVPDRIIKMQVAADVK